MVRRGSQRAKKAVNHHPNSAPAQPGAVTVATSVPALSYGTSVAPSPGNSQQGMLLFINSASGFANNWD